MQKIPGDGNCVLLIRPEFHHVVYQTSVDVVGKHLSGLLLIKQMPDSSIRLVFTSEMGFSFFDFGFLPADNFKVYQVTPQMDKEAVIKTLRKDFDLILFRNLEMHGSFALLDSNLIYHGFPQQTGVNYYVTDRDCRHLIKMQRASDKKPVMEAWMDIPENHQPPDRVRIHHLNIDFSMTLKKLSSLAD